MASILPTRAIPASLAALTAAMVVRHPSSANITGHARIEKPDTAQGGGTIWQAGLLPTDAFLPGGSRKFAPPNRSIYVII